jgi:hypothetical protein
MFGWRRGIIYAYSCINPNTGRRIRWAYVGLTRQQLAARHQQHMDIQPWSDLYPEIRIIFDFKRCPDWWLAMFEKHTIKVMRPVYNYEHNTKNSRRIPKYQAAIQRKSRDMDRWRQLRKPGRHGNMLL